MVGEAMIKTWRDHAKEAQDLLRRAQTPDIAERVVISHLYLAVVEITQALRKLDTPEGN